MSDRAKKYAQWLVDNKDKQGTPEFDTVAAAYKKVRAEPEMAAAPAVAEPPPQPEPELSWYDNALGGARSFTQGLTLGWGDEVGVGIAAATASLLDGADFSEAYNSMMAQYNKEQSTFEAANPVASTGLEIAGGFLSPASIGIAGAATKAGGSAVRVGATGATVEGGIYGAGAADEGERLEGAAVGAGLGMLGGAVVGKGVQKWTERNANKLIEKAQTDIYNNPVAQFATNPNARLRSLGYSNDEIKAVTEAATRTGKTLDVPSYSQGQILQTAIANEGATLRKQPSSIGKAVDQMLGVLSTRMGNISPELKGRLRKFEADTSIETGEYLRKVESFKAGFSNLDRPTKTRVSQLLMQGEYDSAKKLLSAKSPALVEELDNVRWVLDDLGTKLQDSGHEFGFVQNYFPRVMKNYDEWRAKYTGDELSIIDKAVESYAKKKGKDVSQVSQKVRDEIANRVLRGEYNPNATGKMGNTNQRVRDKIGYGEFDNFYLQADEALDTYITRSVNDIKRREFFGKDAVGMMDEDLDTSIGKLVESLDLDPMKTKEVHDMLVARFINGEQQMSKGVAAYRNATNISTIGNFMSTITQAADLTNPIFAYGMRNTAKGLWQAVTRKNLTVSDVGLDHIIAQDMTKNAGSFLQGTTDKLLKATGFRFMDRLGKETFLNAGFNKLKNQAKTEAGKAKIAEKYKGMFGDEIDNVILDLENGRVTGDVKALMFSELSDFQPISMSEMPQAYLNAGKIWGGAPRLMYSLQSFTIKQWDVLRREVIQKAANAKTTSEKLEAAGNMMKLFTTLSVLNGGTKFAKDYILGREIKPEEVPMEMVMAGLGVYGVNKYTAGVYEKEGMAGVLKNYAPTAPIQLADSVMKELAKEDPNPANAVKKFPVAGNIMYYWFGDGIENFEKYRDK